MNNIFSHTAKKLNDKQPVNTTKKFHKQQDKILFNKNHLKLITFFLYFLHLY